ncbi:hypothetical protein P3X46_034432, partial [Hevea brasiliensis]
HCSLHCRYGQFCNFAIRPATTSLNGLKQKQHNSSPPIKPYLLSRNIFCHNGIPKVIITDKGTQFEVHKFRGFYAKWGIDLRFALIYHPLSNSMTEVTNRTILSGLKRRLDKVKGKWPEELPFALWAFRTTPRSTISAMNDEDLRFNLDLAKTIKDRAFIKMAEYHQRMTSMYNQKVKHKSFTVGNLVMKKLDISRGIVGARKLGSNWEGPYVISKVIHPRAYKITYPSGSELPRAWNVCNLKKYYQ